MLRALAGDLLDTLLPGRCPGCGRRGRPLCHDCVAELRASAPTLPPPGVSWWTSLYVYEGAARELVARAKYRNERAALEWLGVRLARACADAPVCPDVVTWAPASATRRAVFGVDHAELLARVVARQLGVPSIGLLRRVAGEAQTGRAAGARRLGPTLAPRRRTNARTILVVDDVATTGGTLAAAARVLREAGARDILAATVARTPLPGARHPDEPRMTPAYTQGPGTS